MADLKTGTTVGGRLVLTQGNFPIFPSGNSVYYNTSKIYTEYDKPQAVDNDFVSKANGGIYANSLGVNGTIQVMSDGSGSGLSLYGSSMVYGEPNYGIFFGKTATFAQHGSATSSFATYFVSKNANYGWIFRTSAGNVASVGSNGFVTAPTFVATSAPSAINHLTRKDYVDGLNTTQTTAINTKVNKAGDTMTGNLTAPNIISNNKATASNHVPRLDQVVVIGTTIDFGTF